MPTSRPSRPALVVMVKAPRPGRVKTRLAADIGVIAATSWYRHQTRRLLRNLRDPRWRVILAVARDKDPLHAAHWPADLPRIRQGRGDLGQRMARILRAGLGQPALIIGSDIPGIGRAEIADTFTRLQGHDAVIGPSEDGGYWGIGLRCPHRLPPHAFSGVRWSTCHAMNDTLRTLAPLRCARGLTLRDIDRAEDLRRT